MDLTSFLYHMRKEAGMSKKEIQNHPQLNQPDLI